MLGGTTQKFSEPLTAFCEKAANRPLSRPLATCYNFIRLITSCSQSVVKSGQFSLMFPVKTVNLLLQNFFFKTDFLSCLHFYEFSHICKILYTHETLLTTYFLCLKFMTSVQNTSYKIHHILLLRHYIVRKISKGFFRL